MYYKVIFKPCSGQLYSHRCIDGYFDKNDMTFRTKNTRYFWYEKDILEYTIVEEVTKEEYLSFLNDRELNI